MRPAWPCPHRPRQLLSRRHQFPLCRVNPLWTPSAVVPTPRSASTPSSGAGAGGGRALRARSHHAVGHDHQRTPDAPPSAPAGAVANLLVRVLPTSPTVAFSSPAQALRPLRACAPRIGGGDTLRARSRHAEGHDHQRPSAAPPSMPAGALFDLQAAAHGRARPNSRIMWNEHCVSVDELPLEYVRLQFHLRLQLLNPLLILLELALRHR